MALATSRFDRENVLGWTGPVARPVQDTWTPGSSTPENGSADFVVGPARSGGQFERLQCAIDEAIRVAEEGQAQRRFHIEILPGWFAGPAYIPASSPPLTIRGSGADRTTLAARIDAQMPGDAFHRRFSEGFSRSPATVKAIAARVAARRVIGTANSAVLRIERDDTVISDLSVENLYACDRPFAAPEGEVPDVHGRYANGQHQAVAVHVAGADRVALSRLKLSSYQDTLYLQSPSPFDISRVFLSDCQVAGDVDFVFGGATAFFDNCELRARVGRAPKSWTLAPSTNLRAPYGFVFHNCAFTSEAGYASKTNSAYLGRQWFEGVRATPYGEPTSRGYRCDFGSISEFRGQAGTISRSSLEAVGKCAIINSSLGPHLNRRRLWDDWSAPAWNPRFRPAQHSALDFLNALSTWLRSNELSYKDLNPDERWLVLS